MVKVSVIIPAYNEELSIAKVIEEIPKEIAGEIIVVNNKSTDKTAEVAEKAGAIVLNEPKKGYGNACLTGIQYLNNKTNKPQIVVFLDGDYSDYPSEMANVIKPILSENIDFVVGSRKLGERAKGSLTPQQIFGNWLATFLIRLFFGYKYTDLGPFRAIKLRKLNKLNMKDKNYGWTVEMQIKALQNKLTIKEVPVNYKQRIGTSKVSGTVKGTIFAGVKIIYTIFKYI
ncbi:MAG: glycosyltransferase family 2 protein [Chlorobi bacterium]|nr:glycosyltransferase family 2 protein [Chlorobiota bacterium]